MTVLRRFLLVSLVVALTAPMGPTYGNGSTWQMPYDSGAVPGDGPLISLHQQSTSQYGMQIDSLGIRALYLLSPSNGSNEFTLVSESYGTGGAGSFRVTDPTNASTGNALEGRAKAGIGVYGTANTGIAGKFEIANPTSTATALYATQAGMGTAGKFEITNANSAAAALSVTHAGLGTSGMGVAATINVTNPNCPNAGLQLIYAGSSKGLYVVHNGASGYGAWVRMDSSNASGIAVEGSTMGLGSAGYFSIDNANNSNVALTGSTTSNNTGGTALEGVNYGLGYGVKALAYNPVNASDALMAITTGTGRAGFFWVNNANSTANVLEAYTPNSNAFAGYFRGKVHVSGWLDKAGGGFLIDHPLDPTNKNLVHSFVESPDMKNIYDGVVTTDAKGMATVVLPDYFQALNRDFRYQLTPIGQFAQAIVATEIQDNQFTIRTDKPNVKVSWQVTGIRQDAYANAHRMQVEVDKPKEEQGLFLYPTEAGQPETLGVDYVRHLQDEQRAAGIDTQGTVTPSSLPVAPASALRGRPSPWPLWWRPRR